MILLKSLLFEQKTENKPSILFVGDSQTASNVSYARRLLISKTISGKIVAKVGASMKKIYSMFQSNFKPNTYDVVCIMGGNNDAGNSNIDTDSFSNIIQTAQDGGSKVILITCPTMEYINKSMYPGKYPSSTKIPEWQRSLASKFDIPVIDANSLFNDPTYFSKDGLHLNSLAQKVLTKRVAKEISNLSGISIELDDMETKDKEIKDKETNDTLKIGSRGSKVIEIQRYLIKLGYSVGRGQDDGIYGKQTARGVKLFQLKNKLPGTGVLDLTTYDLLVSKTKKPNKKSSAELDDKTNIIDPITPNEIPTPVDTSGDKSDTKLSKIAASIVAPISFDLSASQTATANTIVDFFVSKGLTKEQGIGIAANLQAESGYRTGEIGDKGTSMGLAQWHNERMQNLKSWAETNKLDYMSVNGQLEFLWYELNTSEKSALNAIKLAKTPEDAAYAFTVKFERPSNSDAKGNDRASIATSLANKLS